MKQRIKAIPLPLSGVMLGCAALGNLLQSYSETVRILFGLVAAAALLLLVLKLILSPSSVSEDMKNPILASVAGTFPMALMLLSVYVKPMIGTAAFWIWVLSIALHAVLIVFFTLRFMLKPQMPKVFASYFIVYVGIAAASITAPAYNMQVLGYGLFWFAFVSLLFLLGFIGYRYIKYPQIPEPAQPLFCIFAAPASLCLAGYLQSAAEKQLWLVAVMAVLSFALYLMALAMLPRLLRLPFYPSYAAFTFPFVISAIALKQTAGYLAKIGQPVSALKYVVLFQTVIAVILVVYTLVCFLSAAYSCTSQPAVK